MGTTQRIIPGVTGEPNWGALNKGVTDIAKTFEKEKKLESDTSKTPEEVSKETDRISDRRQLLLKSVFTRFVRTGGGREKISRGDSAKIGKAGLKSARRLGGFISSVGSNGFSESLKKIGFGDLSGKTVEDIVNFLTVYCSDSNAGMDETAATAALKYVLDKIALEVASVEEYGKVLEEITNGDRFDELLCEYFACYLFEHIAQDFEEKIIQMRGETVSQETFESIRQYIFGLLIEKHRTQSLSSVDWQGKEGERIAGNILESILKIHE